MPPATLGLTALAPLAWGTTYLVTTEYLPADRPLLTATLRALPAGLVLLAAARRLPKGAWWWKVAVLGTLNIGIFLALLFVAAYRLPGGVAGVLGAIQPLLAAGLAIPLLGERPGGRALLAGLAGVFGVSLVVLRATAQLDTVGVLAGLAGAACMALGTVLTKRWGRPEGVGPLAMTGWQLTVGGLLLLPVALLAEGMPPAMTGTNLLGYGYLAVVNTAVAYWLWFRGIGRLPASSVAFLGLLSPVSAAALGWLALGQSLTPLQLLGMAIALGGTAVGALGTRGRKPVARALRSGHQPSGARGTATPTSEKVTRT
ncbi:MULTISPECIES: EamA family transporter [unclassified Kitasatospora]|uniref:EamA family transporter n=1 Tax=unclassified Kitasatospora TaxID=2633591 RepID=UPI00070B939E|nr:MULTISPECIES: EamA family transporter [unclassified Kitasatospora]KQV05490.1 ABC transporter permease [Kitasatospora sp. Root107]KRB62295.1 ABC transporter permease [Kitasatospora sp. Root187]